MQLRTSWTGCDKWFERIDWRAFRDFRQQSRHKVLTDPEAHFRYHSARMSELPEPDENRIPPAPHMEPSAVREFADFNAELIDDGCELLSRLSDEQYAVQSPESKATIGGHVRHCLEFYEALVSGMSRGTIDYDARRREVLIENDRGAAIERLRALRDRVADLGTKGVGTPIDVRITTPEGRFENVASSLARELETAASHTIHHYAIIAILAKARGVEVDSEFGLALSTRRYRALQDSSRG